MVLISKLVSWYSQGEYDRRLVKWSMTIQMILLGLSLFHQSRAVANITGMGMILAFLQALVTDGGLFVAELTLLRFLATGRSVVWSAVFIFLVAVASGGANVYDFTSHVEPGVWKWWLAFTYGISIPIQVLLLGKVVSQLIMPKREKKAAAKMKKGQVKVADAKQARPNALAA